MKGELKKRLNLVVEKYVKSQNLSDWRFLTSVALGVMMISMFSFRLFYQLLQQGFVCVSDMIGGNVKEPLGYVTNALKNVFRFDFPHVGIWICMLVVSGMIAIRAVYKLRRSFKSIIDGQNGTSEFTTLEELQQQYRSIPERGEEYEGSGGVPISRYKDRIFIDDSPVNNLLLGITRSGKGETYIVPSLDIYSRAEKKASMISSDPKGELVAASYDMLIKRGYKVYVLNLVDPLRSMSFNPLQLVLEAYKEKDYATAQLLANTLSYSLFADPTAKDKFWQDCSISLTNALILAVVHDCLDRGEEEKINMYSVAKLLAELGSQKEKDSKGNETDVTALDRFFESRGPTDIANLQYATTKFASSKSKGNIYSNTMTKLQIFTFEKIAKMTSQSSMDLKEVGFGDKPVAIFMVMPDYDTSNYVLSSIFIRQLYYVLAKEASVNVGERINGKGEKVISEPGKCEREVVFLLDEFGNCPPIEGMANIITVCLGRNIRFNLVIQSYSQLKKLYGDDANTISGNCGNQIYILTNDLDTAEHFSKLVGNKTISITSRSGQHLSLEKNESESTKERALLDPNELMRLEEGESVIVRVIKRQDINRKRIKPKPIFNTEETRIKYRWEYLGEDFDTRKGIMSVPIESKHEKTNLSTITYSAYPKKKEQKEQKDEKTDKNERKSNGKVLVVEKDDPKEQDINARWKKEEMGKSFYLKTIVKRKENLGGMYDEMYVDFTSGDHDFSSKGEFIEWLDEIDSTFTLDKDIYNQMVEEVKNG